MATLYSDQYGIPPNADATTAPIYRGPHGHMAKGHGFVVRGALLIPATLGAGDSAKLLMVPQGVKLLRMAIVPSGDLDAGNSFTFNLGWVSAATAFASASNGLQGTSAFLLTADQLIAAAASSNHNDEMVLTRAAGSLSAGTLNFIAELSQN